MTRLGRDGPQLRITTAGIAATVVAAIGLGGPVVTAVLALLLRALRLARG